MAYQIEADLPPSLACLKNVDTLLRCPICFDYLNISMMTQCSHNFCSLCIRKFLSYKLQCPVCNTQMTEQDLRNNRLLDDLVVTFQAARQQLSKAHVDSPPISPKTPASAVKCKTPREKGQNSSSSIMNNFFQKKLRTPPSKETQDAEQGELQTAQTHNVNDAALHSGKAHFSAVVKEEPMEVMNTSIQDLMPVKKEEPASYSLCAGFETAHSSSPSKNVKPIMKVECPVCSVSVPQHFINKHLDACLTRDEKKESLRSSSVCFSSFSKRRRPITKLVYNLLSMQELKKKLKECHLSLQGSRDQLIRRHQDFVHLYNAQCDSLNPKSAEEIAKEVEANEKTKNQLRGRIKPVMVFSKNQSAEEIDRMHSNYRKQHSSDFNRLIAQARQRRETSKQARVRQEVTDEKGDAQVLHSADQVAEPKSSMVVEAGDRETDGDQFAEVIELSSSPTLSDVSISSSISDIFGPELSRNKEDPAGTSVQKRPSSSRDGGGASSPVMGKRRRKS
ncbi:E3 ubiquitin-protein ligase RAD18 isoform X1 [Melanotaenia boesemani]|uniref:E3 ubiquitin-protein ligase RAD18 isoform X1 n=1 Tax=Melanotaenia boesemani TaxID=1250792 RepID=UPI001C0438AF|nr:E3 ubiquitin-protein ligase RAD18 isoform X1 [Melanotaenia boesemani]